MRLAVAGKRAGRGNSPPPRGTLPPRPAQAAETIPAAFPSSLTGAPPAATPAAQSAAANAITAARPQHAAAAATRGAAPVAMLVVGAMGGLDGTAQLGATSQPPAPAPSFPPAAVAGRFATSGWPPRPDRRGRRRRGRLLSSAAAIAAAAASTAAPPPTCAVEPSRSPQAPRRARDGGGGRGHICAQWPTPSVGDDDQQAAPARSAAHWDGRRCGQGEHATGGRRGGGRAGGTPRWRLCGGILGGLPPTRHLNRGAGLRAGWAWHHTRLQRWSASAVAGVLDFVCIFLLCFGLLVCRVDCLGWRCLCILFLFRCIKLLADSFMCVLDDGGSPCPLLSASCVPCSVHGTGPPNGTFRSPPVPHTKVRQGVAC